MNHNIDILVFGHIPTWAGGRQEHGLANVIYNLALAMAAVEGNRVVLAATDVIGHDIKRDSLLILGWRKKEMIQFIVSHPFFSIWYFLYLIYHQNGLPHGDSLIGVFFKGMFLRRTIRKGSYDFLHLHEASSWCYVKTVPKNVKIVVTFHGPYGISEDIPYRKKYSVLERNFLTSKRISTVFFISHNLQKSYVEYYKTIEPKTRVILNAYDNQAFDYIEPIPHDGLNICTIGTIQPRKGQMRVVEGIIRAGINCQYYTIGAGSDNAISELSSYCQDHQVRYRHLGKKSPKEIRETLAEMDYMILPSSSEGFGLVFAEAIACGVQVILPKNLPIAGEPSIIKPNLNALLLDDCSSEAIEKLLLTLQDRPNYNRKDVADSVLSHTWNEVAKEYLDSYINCN